MYKLPIEKTSKYTLALIDNIIKAMENTKKTLKDKLPKIYSKDLLELLFFEFYTKNEYIRINLIFLGKQLLLI
ncbi:hypothetical protein [Fusobacterium hwasookii]|uniref:hypothetical protein n=1 Tax=Fusobacterium hwasookii TaxID=1583098 RepID=UPI0028EAB00A|nr:hypothetical protein [Fusobacterium hwasookii]